METTNIEILTAISEHLTYPCRKSFVPLGNWKHRLDAQQAFLELWWRNDPKVQKRHFSYFESVEEQCAQFFRVANSIFRQMRLALERGLSPEQEAQFQDAVEAIKLHVTENIGSPSLRLDLPLENRDIELPENRDHKAIIPGLSLERPVLERIVALFLLKDYFYCDFLLKPAGQDESWETVAGEMQVEEMEKREALQRIRQNEQQADKVYESAITIKAQRICDLKTQNDWRFEAWRLFVVSYFIREEGFEELGIPLFYLCNADEMMKQELEAFCTGDSIKSPTLWMWQYHSAIETLALNNWINDVLTRLQRTQNMSSKLLFMEVARPTFENRRLPIYGSPPRYCLYAALFERLLLDPPDWIKELPERSDQTLGNQIVLPVAEATELVRDAQKENPHSSSIQTAMQLGKAMEEEGSEDKYPLLVIDKEYEGEFVLVDGKRLYDGVSEQSRALLLIATICKHAKQKGRSYKEFNKPNGFKPKNVEKINAKYREKFGKQNQLIKTTSKTIIPLFDI